MLEVGHPLSDMAKNFWSHAFIEAAGMTRCEISFALSAAKSDSVCDQRTSCRYGRLSRPGKVRDLSMYSSFSMTRFPSSFRILSTAVRVLCAKSRPFAIVGSGSDRGPTILPTHRSVDTVAFTDHLQLRKRAAPIGVYDIAMLKRSAIGHRVQSATAEQRVVLETKKSAPSKSIQTEQLLSLYRHLRRGRCQKSRTLRSRSPLFRFRRRNRVSLPSWWPAEHASSCTQQGGSHLRPSRIRNVHHSRLLPRFPLLRTPSDAPTCQKQK